MLRHVDDLELRGDAAIAIAAMLLLADGPQASWRSSGGEKPYSPPNRIG
jgi:hypothetical protein